MVCRGAALMSLVAAGTNYPNMAKMSFLSLFFGSYTKKMITLQQTPTICKTKI
jgi:hypothetical protein